MSLAVILQEGIKVHDELKRYRAARDTVQGDWTEDLCGACAVGSVLLQERLKKKGVDTELHVGEVSDKVGKWGRPLIHCWLTKNNQVIDVTITQIGVPLKVFVGAWDKKKYKSQDSGESARERVSRWSFGQSPVNHPELYGKKPDTNQVPMFARRFTDSSSNQA